jgi:hypothetical protein
MEMTTGPLTMRKHQRVTLTSILSRAGEEEDGMGFQPMRSPDAMPRISLGL